MAARFTGLTQARAGHYNRGGAAGGGTAEGGGWWQGQERGDVPRPKGRVQTSRPGVQQQQTRGAGGDL